MEITTFTKEIKTATIDKINKDLFIVCGREHDLNWVTRSVKLVLDRAICPADSFEFTIYHCMRFKAFRHE